MDVTTIFGVLFGAGMILLGQYLEGGHASSILAFPSVLIVFGGTLGAVMVGAPLKDCVQAMKDLKRVFSTDKMPPARELIATIVEMAKIARRDGLLALDQMVEDLPNEFMRTGVRHMVDGVDSAVLREILEAELDNHREEMNIGAKFWEAAGGYSPTIGIVGAVLGLIHTMENLSDPSKIGNGIAATFVATVYGVAGANLFFLPVASKLKRKTDLFVAKEELIMEGILAVQAGHNAHVIEARLAMYASGEKPAKAAEEAATKLAAEGT